MCFVDDLTKVQRKAFDQAWAAWNTIDNQEIAVNCGVETNMEANSK